MLPSPGTRTRTWRWWPDVVLLALGALAVRIPAMLAPTQLGYDDGGYGLAVVAMRQGFAPFRDIFSPQGPLFLPVLRAADLVGLEHLNAPRLASVTAGVALTLAVYAIGIQTLDRGRALLAAGLTATSGVLLWTTGPMTGDGIAGMFATGAVAVALGYRRAPSWPKVAAVTALAGAAVATKSLLVGPALLSALVLVASRRKWLQIVTVPVGASALTLLLALPWGTTNVLDDYVRYHLDKTAERTPGANLSKLATTFFHRDTVLVVLATLAVLFAVGALIRARRRGAPTPLRTAPGATGTGFLWLWAGAAVVVLTLQNPMFRNHLSALVPPATLLVARFRPPWRVVAVAVLLAAPFQVAELRPLLAPEDFRGTDAQIVAALRRLPAGAWALSDTPGLVWRSGHGTDPFFVDPSVLRLDSRVDAIKITEDRLVHAAANPRVCAVAVTAPARFGRYEDLPRRLLRLGYDQTLVTGDRLGLYVRPGCRP